MRKKEPSRIPQSILYDQGYDQGLLSGHIKSIVLLRHLQRTLSPHADTSKILDEAMKLISEKIK